MITSDRPIGSNDIREVRRLLSVNAQDFAALAGASTSDILRMEEKKKEIPITLAFLLRQLAEHGERVSALRQAPTMGEFRDLLESIDDVWRQEPQRLALLLGRHRTSIHRWRRREDATIALPTIARRLMLAIHRHLMMTPAVERRRELKRIWETTVREYDLRGYDPQIIRTKFLLKLKTEVETVAPVAKKAPAKKTAAPKKGRTGR